MRSKKVLDLIAALEPVAAEHAIEVVDAEIVGKSSYPTLRIYIDLVDGGITLDDITKAQVEWLEAIVDERDIIAGEYMLEVSSPGIDRPLRTRAHFEEFAGEDVKITSEPVDGRKKFSGVLDGMDGNDVLVTVDGQQFRVPFEGIVKAHTVGKVDFSRVEEF